MTFRHAIDEFMADMRSQGRIRSDRTEVSYRSRLVAHAEDVGNRDPRTVGRDEVKRTLRRWAHPNTQRTAHAILASFYDWAMEEGIRKDNPARQNRRARKQPTSVYRLTRAEVVAMLDACETTRERRAIHLGICAGLRNAELRGVRGAHFERPGWVHVSADIAKGGRERWVPVIAEAEAVVAEIREHTGFAEYVLPGQWWANPPLNSRRRDYPTRPSSSQSLRLLVMEVARRAGIRAHIHPHLLRHAYGDHVAKHAGLRAAQALLGHVSVDTTASTYVDAPSLDELAASVETFTFRGYPPRTPPATPDKATTGIEPVDPSRGTVAGVSETPVAKEARHDAHVPGHRQPIR